MKGISINNKYVKKNTKISSKNSNTRNFAKSYKKSYTYKTKFFSISSKEELLKRNNKNCFIKNDSKMIDTFKKKLNRPSDHNNIRTHKCLSHEIINKYRRNSNIERTPKILQDKAKNRLGTLFNKNKFKKTIIIDVDGNTNLNFNKNIESQRLCLLDIRKNNNKYGIKPINGIKSDKKKKNCKNDIVKNLLKFYKNDIFDTSTFTETNSLFVNSKHINDKKKLKKDNILKKEKKNDIKNQRKKNKNIDKYNKIADLFELNNDDIGNPSKTDRNKKLEDNNEICDYTTFSKNIPEIKFKGNKINTKQSISKTNSSEFISFLESSIQDDFYQTLIYKKVSKIIKSKDDSFNLGQSISEFDEKKKEKEKEKKKDKYDFENIIHLPMKNDTKINTAHLLNNIYNKNNKENLDKKFVNVYIEKKLNQNGNNICYIF